MRQSLLLTATLFGLLFGLAATVAHAQDIIGLSLRPTEAMPGEKARGTVDIVRSQGEGNYMITVDLSPAAEAMDLSKFPNATAWVTWAVDMDGVRHNIGALNSDLKLPGAAVDYLVAKLYITAEQDPAVDNPTGEPLFNVALRSVEEVAAPAGSGATAKQAAQASPDATKATGAATAAPGASAMPTGTAASGAPAGTKPDAKAGEKPDKLPTTGDPVQDVLAVILVAAALLLGGWRLRTVRV